MMPDGFRFVRRPFSDIRDAARAYYLRRDVLVDSFLEEHMLGSNHYAIEQGGVSAGFFAVHRQSTLTMFHVDDACAAQAQALFAAARRQEQVQRAWVPTGDEQFLSLAMDAHARIEKQAYFARYPLPAKKRLPAIELTRMDPLRDRALLPLADGFLDEEIPKIEAGRETLELYVARAGGEVVGFGVIETSVFLPFASIGMFVREPLRQKGYAGAILDAERRLVEERGFTAVSGCWYYNHNSKKSMESVGGFCATRLLAFYF